MSDGVLPGSFRDPSGFLFKKDGVLYRQINKYYAEHYGLFTKSGLYGSLADAGLLIRHEEDDIALARTPEAYKVIRPAPVPFISYPYEWSFSQLKDAALLTLDIQKRALGHGMSLKDSSAYNVQFIGGRPVFIDTLSFEPYAEGRPWTPYQQFCRHFLAPLALMSYRDIRFNQLMRVHLDGVPLDLASAQLPFKSRFSLALLLHVHAHAKSLARHSAADLGRTKQVRGAMGRKAFLGLLDSLESFIKGLKWCPKGTTWANYYQDDSYDATGLEHKKRLVEGFIESAAPEVVWDFGGNTGMFSRMAAKRSRFTVSWDVDPGCVELSYLQAVRDKEEDLLPLLLDLTNPSPAIGWDNRERMTVQERCKADTVMALALIHHLAISNNVPLGMVAGFLAGLCKKLIIEFVPKDDPKVRLLLASREDIFPGYTREGFEAEFGRHFDIERAEGIEHSKRTLYLMARKA